MEKTLKYQNDKHEKAMTRMDEKMRQIMKTVNAAESNRESSLKSEWIRESKKENSIKKDSKREISYNRKDTRDNSELKIKRN